MTASDKCPYGKCDGSGYAHVLDEAMREEENADRAERKVNGLPSKLYEPYEYGIECDCYVERTVANGVAALPAEFKSKSLADFNIHAYRAEESKQHASLAKRAVERFVQNFDEIRKQHKGKGLYLWSETKGSGKTLLANILIRELIAAHAASGKKIDIRYAVLVDLIEKIKSTFNKDSKLRTEEVIDTVMHADVLVLDDVGVESDSQFVNQTVYRILNHRMTKELVTVFTSNLPIEELALKYTGDNERIASRVNKMAFPIHLPEESIRDEQAEDENRGIADLLFG